MGTINRFGCQKGLKKVAELLGLSLITYHDFRRSGTTWAFEHGVAMQDIKAQGLLKSDVVWQYIKSNHTASSNLATTFRQHLLQ